MSCDERDNIIGIDVYDSLDGNVRGAYACDVASRKISASLDWDIDGTVDQRWTDAYRCE